ncbi:MAG: polyribonucleotide nucleotidyltransferase [Parcubacteria group bacterium LiPW_39]|nr:MAG: polyribonucleotide nucleotidyltransferase [Parcubacteria group bacterium LiPW_39]
MDKKNFSTQFAGRQLQAEFGQLAQQASGSVLLSYGETAVLATVVMSQKPKENCDYLPLTVEYEEKLYAAGKIKGSRFIKREGRPQDEAVVAGRMIDRTIRPRFNQKIRNDIQLVVTVLSFDKENDPDVLGIIAASLALATSNIPWNGPVAGVRIGRVSGQLIVNPTFEQRSASDLDLIVSGTEDKINMMEAGARQVPEEEILAAIEAGQAAYWELIAFQQKIIAQLNPQKAPLEIAEPDSALAAKVKNFLKDKLEEAIYVKEKSSRVNKLSELKQALVDLVQAGESAEAEEKISQALAIFEEEVDRLVHENILKKDQRPDGRRLNEVREISCQVGVLPRTHGSALFNRGTTQALSTVTLGSPGDKQIIDGLEEEYKKRFIYHYNFPPFSVGETGFFRGPGRREIGHGALAERSLAVVIPPEEEFPYTIRVVSEILSSNGSSSMASACGSSLALMDAGVPIKAAVAGIAMGLMLSEAKSASGGMEYKILTDIQGPEDHHGDMDCKIAGTNVGICGLQMDVKIEGVDLKILRDTFSQAREARQEILEAMNKVLSQPRPSLSKFAPRIIIFQIDPEKIREVIGPGGKVINEIIDQTGVKIDIEDSGMVFITSENESAGQKALEWVKNIVREVKPGEIFQGRVTRLINFGAFVEILPGQEGLVHISELAPYRVNKVDDIVKVGDIIPVKVKNIDEQGRINLSLKDARDNNRSQ